MGKHGGSMTAAAISKRIKAKGLGRLRWYCQMCEKQCRDENGFKCHTQSASHQRQLALFAENPKDFIGRFSETFRKEFLLVLRRRFGTSMMSANTVYQEYIKDRDHLHMNATKWTTLSDFVKEMGREGYCRVQDREDGWWMSFVDRDAAEKDRRARDIDRQRVAEEERAEALLQRQLEMAKELAANAKQQGPRQFPPAGEIGPISMEVKGHERLKKPRANSNENALASLASSARNVEGKPAGKGVGPAKRRRSRWQDAPKVSALEEIMRTERVEASTPKLKDKLLLQSSHAQPSDPKLGPEVPPNSLGHDKAWILEGIVVKVTNKDVGGGSFRGKKGKILKVIDGYGARVQMFDSKAVLELDQDDLETVIPKPDGEVILLRAPHRGLKAVVKSINVDSFSVTVTLTESGLELGNVDYEAVSRIA